MVKLSTRFLTKQELNLLKQFRKLAKIRYMSMDSRIKYLIEKDIIEHTIALKNNKIKE